MPAVGRCCDFNIEDACGFRWTGWADEVLVTAGTAVAHAVNTSQRYNTYTYQSSPADGDQFTTSCMIRAGAYTLAVLGLTQNVNGIIKWEIKHEDDSTWATITSTQDWYSAGVVYNVLKTATFSTAEDGKHQLRGTVNGKNASSTNYNYVFTKFYLYQAAD